MNNKNIIKSWREYLKYQDITLVSAIDEINKRFNTCISPNHAIEWEKGTRNVREDIYRFLVDEIYQFSAIQCGFKKIHFDNLKAYNQLMSMPERERLPWTLRKQAD